MVLVRYTNAVASTFGVTWALFMLVSAPSSMHCICSVSVQVHYGSVTMYALVLHPICELHVQEDELQGLNVQTT